MFDSKIDNHTLNAGKDASDPRIQAFVKYLGEHGIGLEYAPQLGRAGWVVVHPNCDRHCRVCLRSFPEWASQSDMEGALMRINLAYQLNAKVHLAMSPPSGCQVDGLEEKLSQLFREY